MMDYFMGEDGLENVYAWSIPVHATVILAEMIYSHISEAKLYNGKDVATSIYLALMNFGLDLVMKVFAMGVMFFFYNHRLFSWDFTV
ncbi:hypothetical protein J3D55_003505 [Chryseobacterium ginsenosidimutans]|uniref:hypothetical protein n=1 Tax=Chryseobacterium ginsenosidimutans TaxID=687846 RepID=UPI00286D7DFA|nr:hypothetical protein [Chryseobacterium ginsenosidimutans]MCS3870589.1 hypothetical protein [Chryseobacterium ginsenosidimutans]